MCPRFDSGSRHHCLKNSGGISLALDRRPAGRLARHHDVFVLAHEQLSASAGCLGTGSRHHFDYLLKVNLQANQCMPTTGMSKRSLDTHQGSFSGINPPGFQERRSPTSDCSEEWKRRQDRAIEPEHIPMPSPPGGTFLGQPWEARIRFDLGLIRPN